MIKMILAAVVAGTFLMSAAVRAEDKPAGDKAEKAEKGKKEKKEGSKKEGGGGW